MTDTPKKLLPYSKNLLFIFGVIFLAVLVIGFASGSSLAADAASDSYKLDDLFKQFKCVLENSSLAESLLGMAKRLFFWLGVIQFFCNGYQLISEGRYDAQAFVLMTARTIFVLGFFYWLLTSAQSNFTAIINSFMSAGESLSGAKSSSELFTFAINIPWSLVKTVWVGSSGLDSIPLVIIVAPIAIIVLLSICTAIITFIVGLCKTYISASVAIYLVGFGANQYTRPIAITAYKAVLCASLELFVLYLLFGIGQTVFDGLNQEVKIAGFVEGVKYAFSIAVASFVFAGLVRTLPFFVSGIVNGSALGGGTTAGAGAMFLSSAAGVARGVRRVAAVGTGAAVGGSIGSQQAATAGKSTMGGRLAGMVKGGYGGASSGFGSGSSVFGRIANSGGSSGGSGGNTITPPSSSGSGSNSNNVNP